MIKFSRRVGRFVGVRFEPPIDVAAVEQFGRDLRTLLGAGSGPNVFCTDVRPPEPALAWLSELLGPAEIDPARLFLDGTTQVV